MNRLILVALGVGILATAVPRAQDGSLFPHTRQLGRAIAKYEDANLQVLVSYEYSQRNHQMQWLLIDFGARSERRVILDREHFKLVAASGEWFPVASQRHFLEGSQQIQSLRQNASIWRRDLGTYLGALQQREALKFFALPGEGVVITGALLDKDRNTFGELYFENPRGSWAPGLYALLVEHPQARLALPITLQ
jgi:hypothetical protein